MGGNVIEITSEPEFNQYINSAKLSIVDFTATWCGPCKMVAPRFEALADKYPNVSFLKVDVDQQRNIAGTYGVRAMPTFMFFQNGQKLDEVVGADIGRVESLVYMKAPSSSSMPTSGGHTLGGGSGSAGTAYVNPWKDSNGPTSTSSAPAPAPVPKPVAPTTTTTVSQSDKNALIEMGFAETRVIAALKATKNSGLQVAMDWLFANPDESFLTTEEIATTSNDATSSAAAAVGESTSDDAIPEEEATASSLKCDDCGRLLRDAAAAEFHAIKTQHQNFSESTQVIKPLTEEEKKIKLEQLRVKMAQKKEEKRLQEIEENKAKEKVRRTTGKEMVDMKEKMAELELKKAAEAKKREKEEDRIAKAKIKAQIELDKKDRAARLEKEKLERQGLQSSPIVSSATASAASAAGPKEYTEARIQFRLPAGGAITHMFPSTESLATVYAFVAEQTGAAPNSFKLATTFPRKVLDDKTKSLKELGLAPSAALAVV
ncbi:UNVERIFIED_CONTAM: hypothetical protein HDU68_010371 [Siphonaria sp. JEL0065]|nr:hypothetical protein HDU68_010371 [Siphonaria sp. JEL0065]